MKLKPREISLIIAHWSNRFEKGILQILDMERGHLQFILSFHSEQFF